VGGSPTRKGGGGGNFSFSELKRINMETHKSFQGRTLIASSESPKRREKLRSLIFREESLRVSGVRPECSLRDVRRDRRDSCERRDGETTSSLSKGGKNMDYGPGRRSVPLEWRH